VTQKFVRAVVFAGCVLAEVSQLCAQRGGDWMTIGNDGQRSSWVRSDAKISADTMRKPGFQLVWKVKLKNEARQLNSLTPPVLLNFYIGYRGFRALGFVGGSSDKIIGIDVDLARVEWEKSLASGSPPVASILCPGGMTSSVTRPTFAAYPAAGGHGFGRDSPAKSGVGEPLEGAVTLKEQDIEPPAPAPPPETGPGHRTAPPPNPYAPTVQYVHAVTSDGKFHSLYVSNGEEPNPPIQFLPPNANAFGLIAFDNTAYVATANECGGVENGVWALNLESKKVTHWKSSRVAGSAGFAVGPDGTLYVAAAGGELVALEPGRLAVRSSYKAAKEFTSSPVVFEYKGKDLIAVATSDGQVELLDSATLGGQPLATTPAFSSANFATGSLASWQDAAGKRWVLAPAGGSAATGTGFAEGNGELKNGAIVAFEVVEENGTPALRPRWVSRDMVSPLPPAIVNGVVFGLSSGEFRSSDAEVTAAQRAQRSSKAVLYALDAATGKELWNSGSTITSFVHSGGLAAGAGRVYVGGHDGTQYAFGFPMEH
jgi:outer membrane protein assembly factor BamB